MLDIPAIKALADAGGWAVVLVIIGLIALGSTKKFRWWVPGWIYEDERAQRGISDAQADRTTKANEKLAAALQKQALATTEMARKHDALLAEIAALRAALATHD